MRTPNINCCICNKPLYRRPQELKKVEFVCCRACRSEAMKINPKPHALDKLKLGRTDNHLTGIAKSQLMKQRVKESNKLFWELHPEKLIERGLKTRGANHYNWKNGISKLQIAIRTCANNLKWIKAVKKRDNYKCVKCGDNYKLEAHHIKGVSVLLELFNITTLNKARETKELWDINNGITLCKKCHYKIHNKKFNDSYRTAI